jgi:membrane protease YdiL (CAAX protease family)
MNTAGPSCIQLAQARPYGWIGLFLSIAVLVLLAILIWIAGLLLIFVGELPIEGWPLLSARIAEIYRDARGADNLTAYIQLPFVLVIGPWKNFTAAVQNGVLAITILLQLSASAAVLIMARWRGGGRWRDLVAWHSWSFRQNAVIYLILLALALALNEAAGLLTQLLYPGASANETTPSFGIALVLSVISGIVLAPLMEELIMRGWLYTALRAKLSAWPTILTTAVIFAVLHSMSSVTDILTTLPLGLAAGYLRERTGSVRATISFHMLHNAIVYVLILA